MKAFRALLSLALGVLTLMLAPFGARAAVTLYAWDRGPDVPVVVLPVPDGMTPAQAWARYVKSLSGNPLLKEFVPEPDKIKDLTPESFTRLKYAPERRSLMLGNSPTALNKNQKAKNWTRLMSARGMKNFILPPAAGEFLSPADRKSLNREVADHFALLLPTGGADIDPQMYGEAVDGARDFNGFLDIHEKNLIAEYVKAERGFIYATCRGAQLTAISLGYSLVQDVPTQWENARPHWSEAHPVQLMSTTNNLAKTAWGDAWTVSVYSNHHQAVDFKPGGFLELAGLSSDGTAELMEFVNGRGLLNQSHPELTLDREQETPIPGDKDAAKKLFNTVTQQAKKKFLHSCGKIFAD